MKKNLIILMISALIAGLLITEIYKVKKDAREQARVVKRQWQTLFLELEQAGEEVKKKIQLRIAELQTEIKLLEAGYEQKLSCQADAHRQEIEKIRREDIEEKQETVKGLLEQARQMMADDKVLEAIEHYSRVLALDPGDPEAGEGLPRAEREMNSRAYNSRLFKRLIKKSEKKSRKEIDWLNRELEQQKENIVLLKEQMREEVKILRAQVRAEHLAWVDVARSKQDLERKNSQVESRLAEVKQKWEEQKQQVQKETEKKLTIERRLWQSLMTRLEEKQAKETKARENFWQERFKSVDEQARERIQALEEDINKKVFAEQKLWQERFEALQASLAGPAIGSESFVEGLGPSANVEVKLEVIDKLKDRQKEKALKMLDQAILYLRNEDYKRAEAILEKAARFDPENKMIQEILRRLSSLSGEKTVQ